MCIDEPTHFRFVWNYWHSFVLYDELILELGWERLFRTFCAHNGKPPSFEILK